MLRLATVLLLLVVAARGDNKTVRDSYLVAYAQSRGDTVSSDASLPAGVVFPSPTHENIAEGSASFGSPGTHVYPATSNGNGAPSNGYGAPSNGYGAPSNGYGAPSNGNGALSNGYGTPSNGYGAPSNGYGAPSNGNGAPSNGNGAPSNGYGAPSNGYGAPSNGYGAPSNGYGAPQTGYGSPGNGVPQPSNGYGAPHSAYGTPKPVYGPPAQHYGTHAHGPQPSYGTSQHYGSPHYFPNLDEYFFGHGHEKPLPEENGTNGNPDRGLHSISIHVVLKILLKALIFKMIVKFIAVLCLLLFLPSLDFKGDHHGNGNGNGSGNKDEERRSPDSNTIESNENLDMLTKMVLAGIGKKFDKEECKSSTSCNLAKISQTVDKHYTLKRLVHMFYEHSAGLVPTPTPKTELKTTKENNETTEKSE